jgi:hypothetical protein
MERNCEKERREGGNQEKARNKWSEIFSRVLKKFKILWL